MNTEIDDLLRQYAIHDYQNIDLRKIMAPEISKAVNQRTPKIASNHNLEDEVKLKNDGYVIFNNFLSQEECETIKNNLIEQGGYNTHVPVYSDRVLRKFSPDYPFNTLSYPPSALLNIPLILKKITDPTIMSLAQSYLDCFATLYSLNSWWHIYKNQVYGTQSNHRDHDDFRFLALFIYLTDVDETNGPHVFYPKTQDGSESNDSITITGKAGTAILADTFATHRGQPLEQGTRLVCWWRYGLYLNNMHFYDGNNNFKIPKETLFDIIPKTHHNEYMFRGFYEKN